MAIMPYNPALTTLSEDAAIVNAVRAKRGTLLDACESVTRVAEINGIKTEQIYEALAAGLEDDKDNPDYWSYKIMQYLYAYMPFGVVGRWFVPIILGYGIYASFAKLTELIQEGWSSIKTSGWYQSLKTTLPWLPDNIVRDGAVSPMVDTGMLQSGLLAVLPPYAAVIVSRAAATTGTSGNAELETCRTELARCRQELSSYKAALEQLKAAYIKQGSTLPALSNPIASTGGSSSPSIGTSIGVGLGTALGNWVTGGIEDLFSDAEKAQMVRDGIVRDANSARNLGNVSFSRNNY